MNSTGKNVELLNNMVKRQLFISNSVPIKIDIFEEEYITSIEIFFKLSQGAKMLKIKFTNILEYGFYYKEYKPSYIEIFKFLKKTIYFI